MRIIALLFILFYSSQIAAQNRKFNLGLSSSIDYNSYMLVDDFGLFDLRGKINYSGGVVIKYNLNERIAIASRILYSTKNFKSEFDYSKFRVIVPNDPLLPEGDTRIEFINHYLDIPLEFIIS